MSPERPRRAPASPWGIALRLLARRDYAAAELRRALSGRGVSPAEVETVLARAAELGYLDDRRYGERLVRALRDSGRAAGPRLVLELRRRGLGDDLVAELTAPGDDGEAETAALRALLARRFAAFNYAAAPAGERRRVVHFLQRRGFSLDRILTELKRTDT